MTANEKVKDYASMTDEQLNREVAERLGWRVTKMVQRPGGGHGYASADWSNFPGAETWPRAWVIDEPDAGDPYYAYNRSSAIYFKAESEAWEHLTRNVDYANDLNAALRLPLGELDLSINIVEGKHLQVTIEGSTRFPKDHDDIARQLTIIWLQWASLKPSRIVQS